jgi:hypothetical protein
MAGSVLGLPTQVVLTQTIRNWATNPDNFIGARYLPLRDFPSQRIQYDEIASAQGMTHAHALDADPRIVKNLAVRRHEFSPYYFKETGVLRESDLLLTRANMTFDQLAGQRLVMNLMAQLNVRLETRIEWLRWQAFNGSVVIADNNVSLSETFGVAVMRVGQAGDFAGGIVTAWSNAAASILGDLNSIASALGGLGAVLDGADLIMNRKTSNYLFKNTELQKFVVNQVGANRLPAAMAVTQIFPMLIGANLVIYDQGYLDDSGVFTRFIPDDTVFLVARSIIGDELGYIASTPSLHNGGLANPQPGKFAVPEDETADADKNPHYSLTTGMYGGPVLLHANWIVKMTVV